MDDLQYLIADILDPDPTTAGTGLETDALPDPRTLRRRARRRFERVREQQSLSDVLQTPPTPGESIHVVSGSKFDFWTWCPTMLDWIGTAQDLYCSTWTANRTNVVEMLELWDAGRFRAAHFLTGTYFKRRETAVYTLLLDGIRARGGRYRAFQNHCKVLLLDAPTREVWLTVEGSANLTSNPRLEQYILTNDRALWEFHRTWFEEIFAAKTRNDR